MKPKFSLSHKLRLLSIFPVALLAFIFIGCGGGGDSGSQSSSTNNAATNTSAVETSMTDLNNIDDNFKFSTQRSVNVNIQLKDIGNQGIPNAQVSIFAEKVAVNIPDLGTELRPTKLLSFGYTKPDGTFNDKVTIANHYDKVFVYLFKVGADRLAYNNEVAINNNQISYSYQRGVTPDSIEVAATPASNTSGQTNTLGFNLTQSGLVLNSVQNNSVVNSSQSTWNFNSANFDSRGKPLNLVTAPNFSASFYDDVTAALPEGKNTTLLHPEYFSSGNTTINLGQNAEDVKITFIHEGAGYRNAFGYVPFTEGNAPTSVDDIKDRAIFIFPNASFNGSGGNLEFTNTYSLGDFPKDTRLLFFIVSNGWNNGSIKENNFVFSTDINLNPEDESSTTNNIPDRQHVAVLWHEESEVLVLGFEDINREFSYCDHDFNDVMFTVSSTPSSAIDKSDFRIVPKAEDLVNITHSYSPAFNQTGVIAFEDLWPRLGDFDFNDVVMNYYVIETKQNGNVKMIQYDVTPLAMGASLSNSYRVQLNTPIDNIKSVTKAYDGNTYDLTEQNGNLFPDNGKTIIEILSNVKSAIQPPEGYSFANTIAGSPTVTGIKTTITIEFNTPVDPAVLGTAPYNSYIAHGGDNGLIEVHLPGMPPTGQADQSLLTTADDDSDESDGRYYQSSRNYPWGLLIPVEWDNPLEYTDITKAYPNLIPWANSNGTAHKNWYSTQRKADFIYQRD